MFDGFFMGIPGYCWQATWHSKPLCITLLSLAVPLSIRRSLSRQTLRKHTLAGARHHAAATGVPRTRSAAQVSGMAVLPQRASSLGFQPEAPRVTVNSALFHNASLNAHIEWRFP